MLWRRWCGRIAVLAVGGACLLNQSVSGQAEQQAGLVFKGSTTVARVHVTVVDRAGEPVAFLDRDHFEVRVDGRPVPVTTFSNEPQPITAVLLMDTSIAAGHRFFQIRDAATSFIEALKPGDRVRLGTYGHEIALSPWLTGDLALLKVILAQESWPLGGATPLIQAVDLASASLAEERRPSNVVVLGTGGMSGTGHLVHFPILSLEQLRNSLLARRQMVYAVRFRGLWGNGPQLTYLARDTGGGDIEVKPDADLAATFTRLAEELRLQYLLGFSVQIRPGHVHRLEVRVRERSNLTVRAPRGVAMEER